MEIYFIHTELPNSTWLKSSLSLKVDCLKRHCITLMSPKAELKNQVQDPAHGQVYQR